jgi:energy-coupling factor transporter ATP-binding protein EcfA2
MLVARGLSAAPPGAAAVVTGFDLELAPGRWIAIAGPNGAGKTTLLLTLAGLWPAAGGVLELDGRPLGPHAPGGRAAVAAVLQDPAGQLLQDSVADEIAFSARNLGCPEDEVARRVALWSARLGLESELDLDPRTLSAGRQQMVLLAAALVSKPRLLFADEAGAHLDRESRRLVLEALREETHGGLAVVWVSQEEEEQAAAGRLVVVGEGGAGGVTPAGAAGMAVAEGAGAAAARDGSAAASGRGDAVAEVAVAPWDGTSGPSIRIARSLGFGIGARGVVAIEGRNGSGKSVLLEAIAGVSPARQVQVSWRGSRAGSPVLASQHPEHQIFAERVGEEVLYGLAARGGDLGSGREAAMLHFEALGFGAGFIQRRTWDLSAAEKRLLQIVAALITPASVVLLDEPTCGLDPDRRRVLATLVRRIGERVPILVAGQDRDWHERVSAERLEVGREDASVGIKTD